MTYPRSKFIEVASRFVGIRETSFNRFPHEKEIWASTSFPDGYLEKQPYCAAFVCHVVDVADRESEDLEFPTRPREAATINWMDWARSAENGVSIFKPGAGNYGPERGDIINFRPHISHIGLVVGYLPATFEIETIEANTSDGSMREGDGIYRRVRKMSICGEFYRLPARARAA